MKAFAVTLATAAALLTLPGMALAAGDAGAGEAVFKKCKACHMVGEGAKNRVGPELNNVIGRTAGGLDGFKYSSAIVDAGKGGLVWNVETLDQYLANPKGMIPKTKMAFAGLKDEKDRSDVIAYLATFSEQKAAAEPAKKVEKAINKVAGQLGAALGTALGVQAGSSSGSAAPATPVKAEAPADPGYAPSKGKFGLGREALAEEIKAWDIDVRPDGVGLPVGKGTVAEGEVLFNDKCAVCHGDFGEGKGRWPVLAGGQDTLTRERPEKTIGSYWPYLSTVYDYVKRAMPFGNARSLSDDDVYAITAYLLYLNDVVTDEEFQLSNENFQETRLPNEANFIADNRYEEPHWKADAEPCMKNCKPEPAKVIMRARVLDVTPDSDDSEGQSIE